MRVTIVVIEIVSLASLAFLIRYDTTTVIDLVHAADLYLWGGAGFSSGKVSYLWTQRDEMFKGGTLRRARESA